ncbi:uncharacterized protein RHOBADRAFT_51570 [Rhodotorula graminis WP1]|uniref:Uncharacterized protein n=1 Tax=Rhodotorula graminis (strain WP1) TaxID=578459 RepID=A0A194SBC1_RHOGW|nr:uncharacterized protein RHOBADRAFT_51570 [Rhodotorula graminis WP1]KPV77755.1 hypothetical protein RHOBADRAFT_51570 [Rhodotorula graminis WP1]
MQHPHGAWRAAECALFAKSEVLEPLQRESPHKRFVLGGLAALAVSVKQARDEGHDLPIAAELANTLVPTSCTPIIVHLPSSFSAATSTFNHPFRTVAGDQHGQIQCHLKFSPLPLDPSTRPRLYDTLVHVVSVGFSAPMSYLSPWAVAAEHLVLGAPVHSAFAAAYIVRLAVSVGTQMASAAEAGDGRRLGAAHAATLLGEALDGMLTAPGGGAVLETWIERFGRQAWPLSMQTWEEVVFKVHRNELGRQQHLELYERLGQFLLPVVKDAKARFNRHEAHALGKFAPAARRANERATTFA